MDGHLTRPGESPPSDPPDHGGEEHIQQAQQVIDLTSPVAGSENVSPPEQESSAPQFLLDSEGAPPTGGPCEANGEKKSVSDGEPNAAKNAPDDESMGTSSEPMLYDDAEAEQFSFVEMYAYLKIQLQGLTVQQAMEVDNVADFLYQLFAEVFADPSGCHQHADATRNWSRWRLKKCFVCF
ncbi:uncharacterized protein IUM83_06211 [Phytophthora cinnamomi]|uniref:uncharacterized protein n=1 Tax=Phytophthora cinnamomi TaxID=4785 RepID=UPI003559B9A6|nr:hypothetical protein IUM83_06211 [Phytophthora cinnamomi]